MAYSPSSKPLPLTLVYSYIYTINCQYLITSFGGLVSTGLYKFTVAHFANLICQDSKENATAFNSSKKHYIQLFFHIYLQGVKQISCLLHRPTFHKHFFKESVYLI